MLKSRTLFCVSQGCPFTGASTVVSLSMTFTATAIRFDFAFTFFFYFSCNS